MKSLTPTIEVPELAGWAAAATLPSANHRNSERKLVDAAGRPTAAFQEAA